MSLTEMSVALKFDRDVLPVGRLAYLDHQIYFEYDAGFLKSQLPLSPFKLPLRPGVTSFDRTVFEGLPGVFDDSLPDGWGRLLFDRFMRLKGVLSETLTPLDRLAHVGSNGMGALIYKPELFDNTPAHQTLDELSSHATCILNGLPDEVLPTLLALNGSSAGARPKVMVGVDSEKKKIDCRRNEKLEQWLVKFPNTQDGSDAGAIEYVYSQIAKHAGVIMMETHLFSSEKNAGYFGTKRFDRDYEKRFHVHTAAGLLHTDFRKSTLDYSDLFALTEMLTKNREEVEKLFRQAIFNVLSHNRDDHLKNFSFIMNTQGEWHLSPAYDATFSSGPQGEQTTTVLGKVKDISISDLLLLGKEAKLSDKSTRAIIEQTKNALQQWPTLAENHGVAKENIQRIWRGIKRLA